MMRSCRVFSLVGATGFEPASTRTEAKMITNSGFRRISPYSAQVLAPVGFSRLSKNLLSSIESHRLDRKGHNLGHMFPKQLRDGFSLEFLGNQRATNFVVV